jgi:hypothetical protein
MATTSEREDTVTGEHGMGGAALGHAGLGGARGEQGMAMASELEEGAAAVDISASPQWEEPHSVLLSMVRRPLLLLLNTTVETRPCIVMSFIYIGSIWQWRGSPSAGARWSWRWATGWIILS